MEEMRGNGCTHQWGSHINRLSNNMAQKSTLLVTKI